MADTILLDPATWDLLVDASGNIALASYPYAMSQDVASAARLFLGELYYDTSKGVPYFQSIIGYSQNAGLLSAQLEAAALSVPGVVNAKVTEMLFNRNTREVSGTLKFTDAAGVSRNVTF